MNGGSSPGHRDLLEKAKVRASTMPHLAGPSCQLHGVSQSRFVPLSQKYNYSGTYLFLAAWQFPLQHNTIAARNRERRAAEHSDVSYSRFFCMLAFPCTHLKEAPFVPSP